VQVSDNEELAEAFAGHAVSAFEENTSSGKSEHLAFSQIAGEKPIEAYIPAAGKDGKIVAVVELYRKDEWMTGLASGIQRSFTLAAFLGMIVSALALSVGFTPPKRTA
jgi:hypothetical protein